MANKQQTAPRPSALTRIPSGMVRSREEIAAEETLLHQPTEQHTTALVEQRSNGVTEQRLDGDEDNRPAMFERTWELPTARKDELDEMVRHYQRKYPKRRISAQGIVNLAVQRLYADWQTQRAWLFTEADFPLKRQADK